MIYIHKSQSCYAINVENHAIFVEGFWPELYVRGRFMKYSMSAGLVIKRSCNDFILAKMEIFDNFSMEDPENKGLSSTLPFNFKKKKLIG